MMNKFGQLGLTTFSNAVNCFAQAVGALATGTGGMYTHVLITGVGERKRDGVETLLTGEATRLGFGRGEIAASLSNWRSLANIAAPLLFASAYNWSVEGPRNMPAVLFITRMVVGSILPELCFRAVPLAERKRLESGA